MHNVFHMSLLEQDITRKERVDEWVKELEFETGNSNDYKVEAIWNSAAYANKLELGQLTGLYYLVAWKGYPEGKNTCKLSSAV